MPKNKTRQVFSLRFSQDELAAMTRAAKRSGQAVREWARKYLLEGTDYDNP
jgi:hypothetical protein